MTNKREPEEIRDEVAALRQVRAEMPHYTDDRYKTNQWALVDAAIETLLEGYTLAELRAKWDNDRGGDARGAAEDALYWVDGGDIPSQSSVWKSVVLERAKKAAKMAL